MELNKIFQGDALEVLKTFESESVHCIITSPPYFGLRDYGVAGQLGLEKTPEKYVENLVKVFHEAKRVLKKDGTFWLNMGDSYGGSGMGLSSKGFSKGPKAIDTRPMEMRPATVNKSVSMHKQLLGMPWRLAFALQADGWILRSDIIWNKPNPMPESVTDRCTKSHEYIFMLTKSERYYYDAEAIKEPTAPWNSSEGFKEAAYERRDNPQSGGFSHEDVEKSGRNKRDVWTVATQPCTEAHFATFPPKLITPMLLAGCPEFVCNKCGKPKIRIIEHKNAVLELSTTAKLKREQGLATQTGGKQISPASSKTIGYTDCDCEAGFSGGIVLDPFMGAGTTGLVAKSLNRNYVGIELNPEYIKMAEARIAAPAKPEKKKRLSYKKAIAIIQESLFPEVKK